MSTSTLELCIYFSVGLIFTLCMPALWPALKLFYFVPCLIRSFYLKPFTFCLWLALGIGFLLDLLSAHTRFGLYSSSYVLTSYLLYKRKRNFFEDSFTTLPGMSFFFSLLATLLQILFLLLFERQIIPLSFRFLVSDLILMPAADMVFALLIFSLPTYLFGQPVRKGSDYFLSKE